MKRLIWLLVLAASVLVTPLAFATGTTGGGPIDLGNTRCWIAEVTYDNTVAAAKVDLNPAWGPPYGYLVLDGYGLFGHEPVISVSMSDYVDYGDGSTIAGDGIFIGTGLDDPLFVNLGALTTTWQVEIVVVAAGTMKSRITAADSQDPIGKFGDWGAYSTTIAIPTAVYANGAGLGIDFNAAGGHTAGDRWLITNYADDCYLGAKAGQISTTRADLDGTIAIPVIFIYQPYELTW